LEKLGILGQDRSAIINHVLGEELRRLLTSGLLKREELDAADESRPETDEDEPS